MTERVLADRAAVDALRRALGRERVVLEVRRDGGEPDWRPASLDSPFDWSAPMPLAGAKRFFFAPVETLLRWRDDTIEEASAAVAPFALFGVRACDLTAIAYQDHFFAADPWYARRRAAALLVGLDCLAACAGGFCVEVDAGPFAHGGFDLNLTPLDGDRVILTVGSARGREALSVAGIAPADVSDSAAAAFDAAEARARATFPARPFVARAVARLDAGEIAGDEWQALGPACFACTGCTSLCPTCSCFTVVDQPDRTGGVRTRQWDSCLLEGFQREASGHHPAPRAGDRVRRFWTHKLSRDFVPGFGRVGCVGCGRCDVTCPGSIGALQVLGTLGAR
jgi:formate hydrogenlyase subunit 6/NADH:ubiquinone oxidoreductase subunit I